MKNNKDIYIINSPIGFGDRVLDYCQTGLINIKNNPIKLAIKLWYGVYNAIDPRELTTKTKITGQYLFIFL